MNINIICIGKLKELYWQEAVSEYSKRLSKYCRLTVSELKEARLPDKASAAEEEAVKKAEGVAILGHIKQNDYVIALEIEGMLLTSIQMADKVEALSIDGKSQVVFVIGGSLGLSQQVSQRANLSLSFSKMTFPHQMMRVVLLEQVYRSFKIIKGEAYHK